MSQVIMLFLLPIGLYTYFIIEKKNRLMYQKTFDDFAHKISHNSKLTDDEKMKLYKDMLVANGYTIVKSTTETVVGERKILSLGLAIIGAGLYIVGLFIYLLYFYTLQKPHVVEYKI